MIVKEFYVQDCDISFDICEFKTQKEILACLDEALENEKEYLKGNFDNPFEDMSFRILYKDGALYYKTSCTEDGEYKKKNIAAIIFDNPIDTWVYGNYVVNEYGVVNFKE